MSLEEVIQEQTTAIKALTAALVGFKMPSAEVRASTPPSAEKPKTEAAKQQSVKPKAKTPEAEQKEDMDAVLEEAMANGEDAEEEDTSALPKGERNEAYIRAHIMPSLLQLAKLTDKEAVLKLLGQFKTADGSKVSKSTDLKPADLERVIKVVNAKIAEAEAAKEEV